jgi:hypothetical protein
LEGLEGEGARGAGEEGGEVEGGGEEGEGEEELEVEGGLGSIAGCEGGYEGILLWGKLEG